MKLSRDKIKHDSGLEFRSIFLYAWDLAEELDTLSEWMISTGLNTVCLASTYHHGTILRPRSRTGRWFMTQGDVCYFHPTTSFYQETMLRPKVARMAAETDWLGEAAERLDPDIRLVAWTIGAHNTDFGRAYPELTIQNAFGDRLLHGLCPSHHDVREYLKALCRDLATHYQLWGIQLEAFGWMGMPHGHHHERDLVGLNAFEQELMSLCFCDSCRMAAAASGIDIEDVRRSVRTVMEGALREAPQRPSGHPAGQSEMEALCKSFARFSRWRTEVVRELVTEIKTESLRGSSCRLLLQSPYDPELAGVVDGFATASYGKNAEETMQLCSALRDEAGSWDGLLQCFIQLGMGIPRSEAELFRIVEAAHQGGCNGVNFYNKSEAPSKMLAWLADVLPAFKERSSTL